MSIDLYIRSHPIPVRVWSDFAILSGHPNDQDILTIDTTSKAVGEIAPYRDIVYIRCIINGSLSYAYNLTKEFCGWIDRGIEKHWEKL